MKAEDIKDRETLEAWLKTRPREDAVVIAHRAMLRVLPFWGAAMGEDWARKGDLTTLPVLRCGLISAVASTLPTADIRLAASASASAANASASASADAADAADAAANASASADAADAAANASASADAAANADAASARAASAADAASARAASAASADAVLLEAEGDAMGQNLWPGATPDWFVDAEDTMLTVWDADPVRWDFWRRWWVGAKSGAPIDPQVQLAIVQGIDAETWKDPDKVADAIAEIERDFGTALTDVDQALLQLPPASTSVVATVRQAMVQHRAALPATFETILGYISLEVERLQSRNYRDDDDAAEAQRQIRTLTTIYEAVERLSALVPDSPEMPEAKAQEAEKLSRLIFRRICEWPRAKPGVYEDNAADLVDGAYRAALVGGFAYLAPMVGAAPDKALIAGAVVFGGKKIVDTAKAAKDAFSADK